MKNNKGLYSLFRNLKNKELRYRRLFEETLYGILILDYETKTIVDVNPFLLKILKYNKHELVGKSVIEITAITDRKDLSSSLSALNNIGFFQKEDLSLLRQTGEIINVDFVSNVYEVHRQKVILCSIHIVNDRKKINREVIDYQRQANLGFFEIINVLSVLIEEGNSFYAGHQSRVSNLCEALAKELKLSFHKIEGLRISALVHDIGKYSISNNVLNKPTTLSDFDVSLIRNHVQTSFELLKHVYSPWPIAKIVLQHHERLDGSGYPNGLKGESIIVEARILGVADTVEAMCRVRPHRDAFTILDVLTNLRLGSGTLYDSNVVNACVKIFNEDNYSFPTLHKIHNAPIISNHL